MRPRGTPSRHLASRLRVGDVLRRGAVPLVELEATMIVGGGSESFRIVRDLAPRLPFMLLPKWLRNRREPVGVQDVAAASSTCTTFGRTAFETPGSEWRSGSS